MSVVAVRTGQGHTVIGEHGELRAYLAAAVAAGRLTPEGLLAQGRMPDGRCFARVQLVPGPPRRRVRRGVVAAAVTVGVAAVACGAWAVVAAVAWVAAHLAAVLGVLVALVVVAVLATPRVCKTVVTVYHRH